MGKINKIKKGEVSMKSCLLSAINIVVKYVIFIIYIVLFMFVLIKFNELTVWIIDKIIEPLFNETANSSLIVLGMYIGSIIIVSFVFNLFYFKIIHKLYKNFYNLSPFLTLLTGLYTAFISMLNFPKLFMENHNEEFKKNSPMAMETWNNYFFVGFLFLVIAALTLNFLKSRQDIKDKEAKKDLIYREIQIEKPNYKYIEKESYIEGNCNDDIKR